jgi:hypothetical protein
MCFDIQMKSQLEVYEEGKLKKQQNGLMQP